MLQSALEEGFAAIGRGLHGENNAIEKAKAVTWTSAAASVVQMASLPQDMPDSVVQELANLSADELRQLLED